MLMYFFTSLKMRTLAMDFVCVFISKKRKIDKNVLKTVNSIDFCQTGHPSMYLTCLFCVSGRRSEPKTSQFHLLRLTYEQLHMYCSALVHSKWLWACTGVDRSKSAQPIGILTEHAYLSQCDTSIIPCIQLNLPRIGISTAHTRTSESFDPSAESLANSKIVSSEKKRQKHTVRSVKFDKRNANKNHRRHCFISRWITRTANRSPKTITAIWNSFVHRRDSTWSACA